jgi:hypothetical protein
MADKFVILGRTLLSPLHASFSWRTNGSQRLTYVLRSTLWLGLQPSKHLALFGSTKRLWSPLSPRPRTQARFPTMTKVKTWTTRRTPSKSRVPALQTGEKEVARHTRVIERIVLQPLEMTATSWQLIGTCSSSNSSRSNMLFRRCSHNIVETNSYQKV